ncbi:hypothetical protein B4N89_46180 [Embleya scabrispora]|uniref:N-acetyltransferase domain-containing protein n=1 Tax=Embleya scabrispora TaxID=159449 RepID=A0A1T3NJ66_9ACTN|nr:GNAT family N-acetyltransferase [Embleya scabrispora]OPC76863.1 hypothetical protein B4N89_46180 [Embleya scabrispora]
MGPSYPNPNRALTPGETALRLAVLRRVIEGDGGSGWSRPDVSRADAGVVVSVAAHAGAGVGSAMREGLVVREACAGDVDMFVELMMLADPDVEPDALLTIRRLISASGSWSLRSLGRLALVAVDAGHVVGALLAGPPEWLYDHPEMVPWRAFLGQRIATVLGLPVRPESRRSGVGRALMERAENDLRAAGRGLVTLFHASDLDAYYAGRGYTSHDMFAVCLPGGRVLLRDYPNDLRVAVKSLETGVRSIPMAGVSVPVVTGLAPDTTPPVGLRFPK